MNLIKTDYCVNEGNYSVVVGAEVRENSIKFNPIYLLSTATRSHWCSPDADFKSNNEKSFLL